MWKRSGVLVDPGTRQPPPWPQACSGGFVVSEVVAVGDVHNGHRWRELVRVLCPPGSYCEVDICVASSREIVFGLRPRHPLGPSLDHVVEVWQGGAEYDPANLVPAHLGCNVRKSNRLRRQAREGKQQSRAGRSRSIAAGARSRRSTAAFDTQ